MQLGSRQRGRGLFCAVGRAYAEEPPQTRANVLMIGMDLSGRQSADSGSLVISRLPSQSSRRTEFFIALAIVTAVASSVAENISQPVIAPTASSENRR